MKTGRRFCVFSMKSAPKKRELETDPWKKVDVSRGMADYDPQKDKSVDDVVRRADRAMYENKRSTKRQQAEESDYERWNRE